MAEQARGGLSKEEQLEQRVDGLMAAVWTEGLRSGSPDIGMAKHVRCYLGSAEGQCTRALISQLFQNTW